MALQISGFVEPIVTKIPQIKTENTRRSICCCCIGFLRTGHSTPGLRPSERVIAKMLFLDLGRSPSSQGRYYGEVLVLTNIFGEQAIRLVTETALLSCRPANPHTFSARPVT